MASDDSWKQLQQVNELVRYADAKAGVILTVNGILVGIVAVRIQTDGFFAAHPVPAAGLLLSVVFLTMSLGLDIAAVMPRLSARGQSRTLLHFEDIADRFSASQSDYVDEFSKLVQDPDQLQRELGAQVWANSIVAKRKYTYVRWSLRLLGVAIATTVLAAIVGAFGG